MKSISTSQKVPKDKKLDARELVFVTELAVHGDVQRAALDAGYTESVAKSRAYEWIKPDGPKPHIAAELERRRAMVVAKIETKFEISSEKVLNEISLLAHSNMRDFCDEEGNLKPIHQLTRDQAAAISEVEVITVGVGDKQRKRWKYKITEKHGPLVTLAKYKGLLKPDAAQVNVSVTLAQLIAGSMEDEGEKS